MSIRYKTVKQVSGFDKTATGKYAVKAVTGETPTFDTLRPGLEARSEDSEQTANALAVSRRKMNFMPGSMFKPFLKDVPLSRPDGTGPNHLGSYRLLLPTVVVTTGGGVGNCTGRSGNHNFNGSTQ